MLLCVFFTYFITFSCFLTQLCPPAPTMHLPATDGLNQSFFSNFFNIGCFKMLVKNRVFCYYSFTTNILSRGRISDISQLPGHICPLVTMILPYFQQKMLLLLVTECNQFETLGSIRQEGTDCVMTTNERTCLPANRQPYTTRQLTL